jgi:hypothetical protein
VVDVRGTELKDGDTESFHVFRPDGNGLAGFAWPRGQAEAQETATRTLVETSTTGAVATEQLRINNACAPCHEHVRELRRGAVPARPTDAAGWFVPETVLLDRAPLERHRPRDLNVDAPFVHFECPTADGAPSAEVREHRDGTRWPTCADGLTAIGVFDMTRALASGDPHAAKVCGSRRALWSRLDDEGRRAFADGFTSCGIR